MPPSDTESESRATPTASLPQSIWKQLLSKVRASLQAALDALCSDLLVRAERAPISEQNRLLDIRHMLATKRDEILDQYCRQLSVPPPTKAPGTTTASPPELKLVSHEEQEEEVLLRILSNRVTDNAGPSLNELLRRLERLPTHILCIGPMELLRALLETIKPCIDDLDIRILAYSHFEEHCLRLLPESYQQWNQQLADCGIVPLAQGRVQSHPRRPPERSRSTDTTDSSGTTTGQPGPQPTLGPATSTLMDQLQRTLATQLLSGSITNESPQQTLRAQLLQGAKHDTESQQVAGWVDMIMEYIRQDQQLSEPTRHALSCLQPAMIRIALQDRSLFTQSRHPARQLLERLTRASLMYRGEALESRVQDRIQQWVLALLENFDGDLSLLTRLTDDIDAFLDDLQQQAERVERRHIEQLQGQERLAGARQYVQECIANRLNGRTVVPILKEFLEHSWVNVLLLLELQHGRDSQAWRDGLALADSLLEQAYPRPSQSDPARAIRIRFELFQALRTHLSLLGELSTEQIDQTLRTLSQAIRAVHQHNTDLLDSLQFTAHPQPIGRLSEVEHRPAASPEGGDSELQPYLKQIESLPFGTWFHFDQAQPAQQKMAWYSPISQNCLFVDRQGHRTQSLNTQAFARLMRDGKVRTVRDSDLESTCLSRILSFLKEKVEQFGGAFAAPIEIAPSKG